MMKIFSRHRDWDASRADRDVSASDLEHVELLLSELSGPPAPDELRGEDAAVAAIAARIRIAAASQPSVPGAAARPSRRAGRVVGIAVCLFGVTTGAAFAGVLPAPVQQVAHDALGKVGVTVPKPDAATSRAVSMSPSSGGGSSSDASLSRQARTPGVMGRTKGTDAAAGSVATGEATGGSASSGQGQGNPGGNGKGLAKGRNHAKNTHGQTTSAAHKNGGQAKGKGKPHPPQGGGKPAGAGGGKPAGAGGGKPAGAGGGKPAGAGGGKPAGAGGGKPAGAGSGKP
jgi:translation initiation factor IF-2